MTEQTMAENPHQQQLFFLAVWKELRLYSTVTLLARRHASSCEQSARRQPLLLDRQAALARRPAQVSLQWPMVGPGSARQQLLHKRCEPFVLRINTLRARPGCVCMGGLKA